MSATSVEAEGFLTVPQFAALIGVKERMAYLLVERKRVGHHRHDGAIRIPETDAAAYLARTYVPAETPPLVAWQEVAPYVWRSTDGRLEVARATYPTSSGGSLDLYEVAIDGQPAGCGSPGLASALRMAAGRHPALDAPTPTPDTATDTAQGSAA